MTYLELVFLRIGHTVVGLYQPDGVAIGAVREGSLVTGNALSCESLEYLLEGRLLDVVLFNAKVLPLMLYMAKEPSN